VCYAPGKSIPEAPTAASVRQDFYMEVTLALSNPLDLVFKQNPAYTDTINSLFMECMCVSLFHPSSCFQHPAFGYQCSFHFKPKTKVNFMAK